MAGDALEPGAGGTYPFFPRLTNGAPAWSDSADTDGKQVPGRGPGGLVTLQPRGIRTQRENGKTYTVDLTPRGPGGIAINPPVLP